MPRLYRSLSGFLTLSAIFSHPDLVALFHATSTPRISGLQSFSLAVSRDISRYPMLSCRFASGPRGSSELVPLFRPYFRSFALPSSDEELFRDPVTPPDVAPSINRTGHPA